MKLFQILSVALLLPTISVYGQQQMASLTGNVTDTSGASIPGAQIAITDVERETKIVVISDDTGDYHIEDLGDDRE